jgi:hypothetical protein
MYQTMSSSSPTQPPPTQTPALIPENKPVPILEEKQALTVERKSSRDTPLKRRIGETRTAHIIKGILRPPIKALYYLSNWTKKYKLASLGILLLLVASISATTYYVTGQLPLGINHDPFKFNYDGGKGEGNLVKSWLYALRDGETTHLILLDQNIAAGQAPDPTQLVTQFSETKAHLTWGDTSVIAVQQQPDSTVDSFVQVPILANGPGSSVKAMILWHFVTVSANGQSALLGIDLISMRPLQS